MNTKQQDAWEDLVQQCKAQITERPYYSSINVASQVRSDTIVAAGALVELVTPELAALLLILAEDSESWAQDNNDCSEEAIQARALAARIREALAQEVNE